MPNDKDPGVSPDTRIDDPDSRKRLKGVIADLALDIEIRAELTERVDPEVDAGKAQEMRGYLQALQDVSDHTRITDDH